jgi:hypothetical protein
MAYVTKLKIDFQTGSGNTVFATWKFSKSHLDYYRVYWYYSTGDGIWFNAGSNDIKIKQSTYTVPANATKVKVSVKPVSTKRKVKGKMKSYWTGTYKSATWNVSQSQPDTPSAPQVSIDKYRITAYLDVKDDAVNDRVEFYVVRTQTSGETSTTTKYTGTSGGHALISAHRATYIFEIEPGGIYRVRCRVHNRNTSGTVIATSAWSPYSSDIKTIPGPVENVHCRANSKTIAFVGWDAVEEADSYEVEYTDHKEYFNSNPNGVRKATSETAHAEIPGLESGRRWYFRVRAVNAQGSSGWRPVWDEIVSVVLGTKPQPPTTWMLSSVLSLGDTANVYWTHNTEDGSKQTDAIIELTTERGTDYIYYVDAMNELGLSIPTTEEDEAEKTYSFPIDTVKYGFQDSDEVKWRIKTKGIDDDWSDWSIERSFKVYETAYLHVILGNDEEISDNETLTSFPYNIRLSSGPSSQTPITYHISILAKESYETEDYMGQSIYVTEGSELYSQLIVSSDRIHNIELLPSMLTLEDGREYTVKATVSMNSGLVAESSADFNTEFEDYDFEPDAVIDVDQVSLSATIMPRCYNTIDEDIDEPTEPTLAENVLLSVYRREYDGRFTEIERDIPNDGITNVLDPHPALDFARYRIVAQSSITGTVVYEDYPGEPIGEPSIVIQWDEQWINFDRSEENPDALEDPTWIGNMVKLPYNVKVSEKKSNDVSLIKYAGRSNPVGYYGTHKNENGNWSTVIPTTDTETLYLLRQLANWPGDVYVREPSGVGYWANIIVDISIEFKELTIPVSFTVTRVEGGK